MKKYLNLKIFCLLFIFAAATCWLASVEANAGKHTFVVSPLDFRVPEGIKPPSGTRYAANTSTINPSIPVQNSPLSSQPIRNNFTAAMNDVNTIYGLLTGVVYVNVPNTFTALQTFTNSDLALLGSGTGYTTFFSANTSTTNYTLTIPAASGTIAVSVPAPLALSSTSGAVTWNLAQPLPTGLTANTVALASDSSAKIATDAFVQAANLLQMATVPLSITSGTYSFASTSTNFPVMNCTASGGAVSSCTVFSGGSGLAVGDVIVPAGGNGDALLVVATATSGAANTVTVVYGGTGYTTQSGIATAAATVIPYTYLLSGTLTGNVTIIVTNGTYLNASQQWFFANNTTGSYTVTVCVSNGSDACTSGRTAVIPQGSNNSRTVGVQTDGELNVDIASIVNAADLTGTSLPSTITGSSLTSVGTITSGVWHGSVIAQAYGGSTAFAPSATAGGTANAQTFASGNPTSWTLTAGNTVCGLMGFTNTGATTLAVNSTTATAVNRRSTSGLTALVGGELVASQNACFTYDGTVFELMSTVPGAVEIKSGNYTVTTVDGNGDTYDFTATSPTLTLIQSTTLPTNWHIMTFADGGPITVTPYSSDAINGGTAGASVTVPKGNFSSITTDGAGNIYVSGLATPLAALATQSANTVLGNATSSSATPTALSMTSCSATGSAVTWTSASGFGCGTTFATLNTADQTFSGGITLTAYSIGTESSGTYTIDCGKNPVQYLLNGGAFVLAAPANDGNCLVQVVNGPSAGAVTLSGFSTSPSGTGDTFSTTNTVSATCTISNASPAVITYTNTFVAGQAVYFTTSGSLPTGITASTIYYVISTGLSGSSFEIAATPGGTAINTSSAGSGTQTIHEPSIFTLDTIRINGLSTAIWKQQQ